MAESESKAVEAIEVEDVEEASDTEESKLKAPAIRDKEKKVEQVMAQMLKNPQVLAALQERLESLAWTPSGYIESLPRSFKRRINALKKSRDDRRTPGDRAGYLAAPWWRLDGLRIGDPCVSVPPGASQNTPVA